MVARQEARSIIARAAAVLLLLTVLPYQAAARVFSFRATVPFQFVLGRETLPAAAYIVDVLIGQSHAWDATGVIVLKTPDGLVYRTAFTTVEDRRGQLDSPRSSLVFSRLQGKQYLARVAMANVGVELGISSQVSPDATTSHSTEVPMETLR
jgi:hypothetical protein